MAGARKIKGITIELGADTSQFQKAMSNLDRTLKDTQSKLKDIDKLLKLNPGNTELLKQKQEALNREIANTKTRLDVLKEAYAKLSGQEGEAARQQQEALSREIIETEGKLKSLTKEYKEFGSVASQKLQAVGQAMKDVGDKMADMGKDLSMKLTAPIVAVGTIGVTYNAQMEQLQTLFTTLTGSAEEADRVIQQIQADAQRSPFDVQSLIKANQYLISAGVNADDAREVINALGDAIAATGGGNDELDRMAMNLQQIQNVGRASSQDIKQFANAGINIYGLLAETMGVTTEQVKKMDVSYEDLAKALKKASAQGGKFEGAMESQSKTTTGSINKLKSTTQTLLGEITQAAMPVINKVIEMLQKVVDWFSSLDDSQKTMILKIAAVVAAIGPALVIGGKVISILGMIVSGIGMLMNPIGLAVTAVVGLIAIFSKLNITWDGVISKVKELGNKVKDGLSYMKQQANTIMDGFKNMFTDKWNSIINFVNNQVNKLKNLFNFKWELPKIELPHFFNSGNTGPLGLPKIQVEWYSKAMKNGMILDEPTIFGAMNGKLLGAGEAGAEVIIGANSLYDMIKNASQGTTINMTVNGGNVSATELADIVIDKLTTRIQRGNQTW